MLPDNLCSNGIIKLEAINDYLRKGKKDVDIETEMEWEFDELEFDEYDNDGNEFPQDKLSEQVAPEYKFDLTLQPFQNNTDKSQVGGE